MAEIKHQIPIKAAPDKVYAAKPFSLQLLQIRDTLYPPRRLACQLMPT